MDPSDFGYLQLSGRLHSKELVEVVRKAGAKVMLFPKKHHFLATLAVICIDLPWSVDACWSSIPKGESHYSFKILVHKIWIFESLCTRRSSCLILRLIQTMDLVVKAQNGQYQLAPEFLTHWPLWWLRQSHCFLFMTPVLRLSHQLLESDIIYILGGKKWMASAVSLPFKSSTTSSILFLGWILPNLLLAVRRSELVTPIY